MTVDTNVLDVQDDTELEKDQLMQLVGFVIGNEVFGVDILMVQEIIRGAVVTTIPNSPEFVEGVINLRGNIIPVIDLRKRLNLYNKDENDSKNWVLLLNVDNRITGFVVDQVTQVLKVQHDQIEPPPDIVVAGLESQYINGVCEIDDYLLILLDFDRILLMEEINKLKQLSKLQMA